MVLPNPYLKLIASDVPRRPPSAGPAAHSSPAVQRVTPSAPALQEPITKVVDLYRLGNLPLAPLRTRFLARVRFRPAPKHGA